MFLFLKHVLKHVLKHDAADESVISSITFAAL